MPAPPIQVFLTTIASQPALRQRQEYILRILQTKNIPFDSYDLASDEDAKRLWRRKAPQEKQQLPGILVGGVFPGGFTDFEEAVEFDELDTFLRRNDLWDETIEETRPPPPVKPIGVPGAASPSEMARPEHKRYFTPSPQPSPAPLRSGKADRTPSASYLKPGDANHQQVVDELRRRNESEFDIGEELSGLGLQGVKVTENDLLKLVEELGLEGDEANELAKDLGGFSDADVSSEDKRSGSKDANRPQSAEEPDKASGTTDQSKDGDASKETNGHRTTKGDEPKESEVQETSISNSVSA